MFFRLQQFFRPAAFGDILADEHDLFDAAVPIEFRDELGFEPAQAFRRGIINRGFGRVPGFEDSLDDRTNMID
jgi:hypothetical protein